MKTVTIIGFNGALASAITGIIDLFRLAGVTWARIHGQQPTALFKTRLLTEDGAPCRCINGLTLVADGAWQEVGALGDDDLLVIPTIGAPIAEILASNQALVQWLAQFRALPEREVRVASNCTGAFLLAAAGLLDGREATTHWGFGDQFRRQFPAVNLHPEKLVTVDGPIACAGGGTAWWDLGVYLVERFAGPQTARELAKAFVIDAGRTSQAPYSALQSRRYHNDPAVFTVQNWLDSHYGDAITIDTLCQISCLSERTLLRRFKQATGETPHTYLQLLRIEVARTLLETGRDSLEQITQAVGYSDVSSFTRLFRRHTGLSPSQYRARFSR